MNLQKIANLDVSLSQWTIAETDTQNTSFTAFRLDDVMADVVFAMSKVANPRDIQIIFEPNHSAIVYAHQDMIYSLVHNLVNNAIKFSQKGETIKISSQTESDTIKVSISNSGVGISAAKLNQLFDVDPNSTILGTVSEMVAGIELLLCHQLIERNNGELSISSGNGSGITFTFTLLKVT